MPTTPSTIDLYTTVKNLMGVDHVFGYLPPHGKKLRASSAYTLPGDLLDNIMNLRPGNHDRRGFKSLERDLIAGRLAILHTPKPIYYDSAGAVVPAGATAPAGPAAAKTAPKTSSSDVPDPKTKPAVATHGGGHAWEGPSDSYSLVYTYKDAKGETKHSPPTNVTLSKGHSRPTVTIPKQDGAGEANVYMGTKHGSEPFLMNVKSSKFDEAVSLPADLPPANSPGPGKPGKAGGPGGPGGPDDPEVMPMAAPPVANGALLPPPLSAPTVIVNGGGSTGGLLAAGAYFLKYSYTNANGESIASPESAAFTVVAGQVPAAYVPPAPYGYTGIKIYLTQPGGLTATEIFYDAVPIPPGGFNSILTGYLQPGVGGTGPAPLLPFCQYLLRKPVPAAGAAPLATATAVVNPPTFKPVGVVSVNGQPQQSPPLSVITPYLAPGAQGDVINAGLMYGGAMAVGTYRAVLTYSTAAGETTVGPESDPFTVTTSGQVPCLVLTPPGRSGEGGLVPAGVTTINVYLTLANGAPGSEQSYVSTPPVPFFLLRYAVGAVPAAPVTAAPATRAVSVISGALAVADPSWGAYMGRV
jgi:hypothetical protein